MIDGMPITYITPIDIHSLLQAAEDYSSHYVISSFFRALRYICAFLSLVLPAAHVSITTFHQEMIPTKLAIAIISSKQGVPFPTYLEVILMLLAFEVLIEAGLRLPQAIAQAVSIVGALVVGQAAIAANILSPGIVIIIAVAGMAGFVVTSQDLSNVLRLLRMLLVLLSIVGGLFTVTAGLIVILYMMCSLEVFGTPYLSPLAGSEGRGMFDDTVFRRAWNKKTYRPSNIKPENIKRQRKTRDSGLGDGG
jgi:spore germination protein KA